MHLSKLLFLFLLIFSISVNSQIKIGDNPQNIDASSILELESTTRAFVITRVNTAEMNAIVPIEGAMVYNTDIKCLHYYDGTNWLNICEALGLTITNYPIIHADTTIAITRVDNNINIEVDSITGLQIVDRSIRGDDIAGSAVNGSFHIQNRSTPVNKLIPSAIPNQILKTNAAGTDAVWAAPPISPIAFGKINGATILKSFGISSVTGIAGVYTVNLTTPRADANYIIQLTVSGDNSINVIFQTNNAFVVQIWDFEARAFISNADWYFTVFDN
jgi:hypothetical protein